MLQTEVAAALLKKYGKKNAPELRAGDTVRVHQKIKEGEKERVQVFEGLVIAVKHGKGLDATYTVRKIAAGGIGVERTFPLHSPNVVKVERTKTAKVSRTKLYYMRDRMGKNARFKSESANPASWTEPEAVVPVAEPEPEVTEAEEIREVLVEDAAEQEEVLENVAEGEPVAEALEEAQEEAQEAAAEEEVQEATTDEEKTEEVAAADEKQDKEAA